MMGRDPAFSAAVIAAMGWFLEQRGVRTCKADAAKLMASRSFKGSLQPGGKDQNMRLTPETKGAPVFTALPPPCERPVSMHLISSKTNRADTAGTTAKKATILRKGLELAHHAFWQPGSQLWLRFLEVRLKFPKTLENGVAGNVWQLQIVKQWAWLLKGSEHWVVHEKLRRVYGLTAPDLKGHCCQPS